MAQRRLKSRTQANKDITSDHAAAMPPQPKRKISYEALARSASRPTPNHFEVPRPPPGVVPDGAPSLGMDNAISGIYGWANQYTGMLQEGLAWPGFVALAELSQRAEYRKIAETISREATRKWLTITASGDEDKGDKVKGLTDAFDQFKVRDVFREASEADSYFGRGTVFIDTGFADDPTELATPLVLSPKKIPIGGLKGIRTIDPLFLYPAQFNSTSPLRDDFYKPSMWYCNGTGVHISRLMMFVARPLPPILRPGYSFAGLSMSQMARPYIDNFLRARTSISDLLHSFSTMILATNMGAVMQGGGGEDMIYRAQLFNQTRDNRGLFMINKEDEEVSNVSVPLGNLDRLQSQAQEQIASVSSIPLIKLLGTSPQGLNASSEGELLVFYDSIHSYQEHIFGSNIEKLLKIMQLHLYGEVDPDIGFRFEPLWQMNELEKANIFKTYADSAVELITAGVLNPADERQRLADDEQSPYRGIDINDLPDPPPDLVGEPDDDDTEMPANAKGEPDNAEFKGEA